MSEDKEHDEKFQKSNMALWNQVCTTDISKTKPGLSGLTSIAAYTQFERATELWGTFGNCWGIKDEKYLIIESVSKCLYTATFFYPKYLGQDSGAKISFPTRADISIKLHDFSKKAATAALTKALSMLGWNADIFKGQFDDADYKAERSLSAQEDKAITQAEKAKRTNKINELKSKLNKLTGEIKNPEDKNKAVEMIKDAKGEFKTDNFNFEKAQSMIETIELIIKEETKAEEKEEK